MAKITHANFRKSVKPNGYRWIYERSGSNRLKQEETVILQTPPINATQRAVNDFGWQTNGTGVAVYGTMSENPYSDNALWSKITNSTAINKTVSGIMIINNGAECDITVSCLLF